MWFYIQQCVGLHGTHDDTVLDVHGAQINLITHVHTQRIFTMNRAVICDTPHVNILLHVDLPIVKCSQIFYA